MRLLAQDNPANYSRRHYYDYYDYSPYFSRQDCRRPDMLDLANSYSLGLWRCCRFPRLFLVSYLSFAVHIYNLFKRCLSKFCSFIGKLGDRILVGTGQRTLWTMDFDFDFVRRVHCGMHSTHVDSSTS